MIAFVDTSALVRRVVADPDRSMVVEAMAGADVWCASALARTEASLVLHRLALDPYSLDDLWRALNDEWPAFHVVPVDDRCLSRAAELGARFGLRTVDAIHLAAADRLPRPISYVTLDHRQIPAATALDLTIVSPVAW